MFTCIKGCNRCCIDSVIIIFTKEWRLLNAKYPLICKSAQNKGTWHGDFFITFEGGCGFLGKSGCLIYPDRPSTCRTFPLLLEEGEIKIAFSCPAVPTIQESDVKTWAREAEKHSSMITKYMKNLACHFPAFKQNITSFKNELLESDSPDCLWFPANDFLEVTRDMNLDERVAFYETENQINVIMCDKQLSTEEKRSRVYQRIFNLPEKHKKFILNHRPRLKN